MKLKDDDINQSDLNDVSQWLNTSVENLEIHIIYESISKYEKQIKEMYATYDEFPQDAKRTQKIRKLLNNGEKMLPIYVEANDESFFVMEGRHRMVAFWLNGFKEIPVAYVNIKHTIKKKNKP